jgi:thiol-disulfide isomerase/thioredoxin
MSKKSKIFFVIIIITLLLTLLIVGLNEDRKKLKKIDNIVDYILTSKEDLIVYLGASKCPNCEITTKQIGLLMKYYDFSPIYIDTSDITTDNDKNRIYSKLGLNVYEGVTTPSILFYKNGKIVDSIVDVSGIDVIFKKMKNNNIIKDEDLKVEYLNYNTLNQLIDEKDNYLIAITSYKYKLSLDFDAVIWYLENEYDLDIKMLYVEGLSDEEGSAYLKRIGFSDENGMQVPVLFFIADGKIKDSLGGIMSVDYYIEFLEKNDIIY